MLKWSIVMLSVLIAGAFWLHSQKPAPPKTEPILAVKPVKTTAVPATKADNLIPSRPACVGPKLDPRPVLEICRNPTELQRKALEKLADMNSLRYVPEQCEALYAKLRQKTNQYQYITYSLDPLKTITQLKSLDVGYVETCDYSMLAEMTVLEVLEVANSRFYDLSPLSKLSNLRRLSIINNRFIDLSPLSGLTGLVFLDVRGSYASDLTPLIPLKSLTTLGLLGSDVKSFEPLTSLPELEELDLSLTFNRTQAGPAKTPGLFAPLGRIISLKSLTLNGVAGGTLKDLPDLRNLHQLERLEANENSISDLTPLSHYKSITWLSLQNNHIVDLSPLSGLDNLEQLFLQHNQIEDVSPLSRLPNLGRLRARKNPIKKIMPLSKAPNLWDIDVDSRLSEEKLIVDRLYLERATADPNHRDHGAKTMQDVYRGHKYQFDQNIEAY